MATQVLRSRADATTASRGATQADYAYEAIRAEILSCRFLPASKINISKLASDLDVSLGAVREALSHLAAEGMTVATAQKGFRVPDVSAAELLDLTETRIAIEGLCLRRALREGDLDWETQLVAAFHRLQRLPEREPSDPDRLSDAWSDAHRQFHHMLVSACNSPALLRIQSQLFMQTDRYRRLSVPLRVVERNVAAEHAAIFDAAMARDGDALEALMGKHLMATAEIIIEALNAPQGASAQVKQASWGA